ncbi:MAG: hypothetical protein KIT69_13000, partial [Propionibacteriaceae bacterium]|nr:hypothetical protein [Propionibacteriaceae bacterium]
EQWRKRVDELGFLGIEPSSTDTVNGATEGLVVLGNGGEITLTFSARIQDGDGDDFAVFENGFRINNTTLEFAELAYIEVSSDGEHFARFDTGTTNSSNVGQYSGLRASDYGGVAGQYWTGWGTGFDLAALKNHPEVRSGLVDLSAISHVRVLDIAGCGEELDSWGRPIYDPCGTVGSGGFDLTAIGVLNPVRDTVWIDPVTITALTMNSANVVTKFKSQGKGNAALRLELADDITGANARTVATANAFSFQNGTTFTMAAANLTKSTTYAVRIVARQTTDGVEVATPWRAFSTKSVTITAPSILPQFNVSWPDEETATATTGTQINTGGGADQEVYFEYATTAEKSDIERTPSQFIDGGSATNQGVAVTLTDLRQEYDYWIRAIATDVIDGTVAESDWTKFTTYHAPQIFGFGGSVTRVGTTATLTARNQIDAGSWGRFTGEVHYTTDPTHETYQSASCGEAPLPISRQTLTCDVPGLELGTTYWGRMLATNRLGTLVGTWAQFSTTITPSVTLTGGYRAGTRWQVLADVANGSQTGPLTLRLAVRNRSTNELVTTLDRPISGTDPTARETFAITGLESTVAYSATATLLSGSTQVATRTLNGNAELGFATTLNSVVVNTESEATATIGTSGGRGAYDLVLEISEHDDGSSPRRIIEAQETGAGGVFTVKATGLTPGATYWMRSVQIATDPLANGSTATSAWTKVVMAKPAITIVDFIRIDGTAVVTADVYPGAAPQAYDLVWRVASGSTTETTTRVINGTGSTQRVVMSRDGLLATGSNHNLQLYRSGESTAVASASSGSAAETAPTVFDPAPAPGGVLLTVVTSLRYGTYGPYTARIEIAETEGGVPIATVPTTFVSRNAATLQDVVSASYTGLKPAHPYWVRTVMTNTSDLANKRQTASAWKQFRTQDLNQVFGAVKLSFVDRTLATLTVPARAGMYDRLVVAEVESIAGGDRLTTDPQTVAKRESGPASFTLAGLEPNTAYRARLVSSVPGADDEVTSWLEFRTAAQPAIVTEPAVTALGKDTATIAATLTPGDLDQQVWLEYTDGDHADAAATAAKPV